MNALRRVLIGLSVVLPSFAAGDIADVAGRWEVTTVYPGGYFVAGLDLTVDHGRYTGKSSYLVPDWDTFWYTGAPDKNGVRLKIAYESGYGIGDLNVKNDRGTLRGSGTIHGIAVTLVGHRPLTRPTAGPVVHDYEPTSFWSLFSGTIAPVLHVFPGDTIRTKTVDSAGLDDRQAPRVMPASNPQTGPFYIEGAMPGDTLAVHFNKIQPNRDSATQYRFVIDPRVLEAHDASKPVPGWSHTWTLDRAKGIATPDSPSDKLKGFSIELAPMLGCVGVAPYGNQAISAADLGPWGGNLDYNRIRAGTTLYLPVYQAGALLTLGDGHARQGDGEITGQGLEISMDVEFTVDVVHGEFLNQPWAEDDEYIMVSGIDGSLTTAMQAATSGLSKWLAIHYGLNASEAATVLANTIQYDLAEAVDPHVHVVARVRKDVLQQIPR